MDLQSQVANVVEIRKKKKSENLTINKKNRDELLDIQLYNQ